MAKPALPLFLKEWRNHNGYSQERLAEMIGTTGATISRIEGRKQNWDQAFLEAAAEALRCTPADLLRRRPDDAEGIETAGLAPEQVALVKGMVAQMRKAG